MEWEFGVIRCKLSYIEWINNKVLLDSRDLYLISCDKHIMEKNIIMYIG